MSVRKRAARFLGLLSVVGVPSVASSDDEFVPHDDDVVITQMSQADMVRLRMRAWALFEEIRAVGLPPYDGWFIERDAFGNITCSRTPTRGPLEAAAQRVESEPPLLKALVAAPEPDDLYEATYFNTRACLDIQASDFPLNDLRTTDRLLALQRGAIDEFSIGAQAIKTFWRPLPTDNSSVEVGIWQWPTAHTIDRMGAPNKNEWQLETIREPTEAVASPRGNWIRSVCVQLNPPAGSACLKAEDYFPIARVDTSAGFPQAREVQPRLPDGQPLILLAVHVASKESPDWLWATYWWKGVGRTSGHSWTCDNAQRAGIPGPWGNFSTNVSKSFKLARPDVDAAEIAHCGVPGRIGSDTHKEEFLATYNPFVEGMMDNGRKSSCIACHARANTRGDVGVARFLIPPVGEVEWPAVTHFEGHIRTDYLWTVRNHLGPSREPEPTRD
jgi:hypothetical protein